LKSYRVQLLSGSANLTYEAGEYAEAAGINRQIIELNPEDKLTSMNLAFCLAALGKKQEAENQAHKGCARRPA
jgi:Flp pilus assembly protein TadD